MLISLTVTGVRKNGNKVYVQFSDNSELEFTSLQHAKNYAAQGIDVEHLRRLAINRFLAADPTGANIALIVGKTITFDNSKNAMVTVA